MELIESARRKGLMKSRPDAIFTTSMISAGDLMSMLPRSFRQCPLILYMHENQAAYPFRARSESQRERDHQYALTNLTSMAAADLILWNTEWNRDSFCTSIKKLIDMSPDGRLGDVGEWIRGKSDICWPPVGRPTRVLHNSQIADNGGPPEGGRVRRIVWPHRWEHDKGPDTLLRLARFLRNRSPGMYRWVLLGERFRRIPRSLETFLREFEHDIDHAGWVESRDEYWGHLADCSWVLSTARHEFFGIAVVEAMLAGCLPWLPDRLSYPEILPASARGLSPTKVPSDLKRIREDIRRHLMASSPEIAVGRIDGLISEIHGQTPARAPSDPLRR